MTTTRTRSRDRRDSRSSAAREGAERRPLILMSAGIGIVLLAFGLAVTSAGHVVLAASDHFLLRYSGVFALLALTGSVCMGVVAADRIVMTPGHRVLAQAVHRAVSFGALAFLIIHIVLEITAPHLEESNTQHVHLLDAFIPFLSQYRTFYMAEGTIASDIIVLLVITGIIRRRFTASGHAWKWRAIHYSSYAALILGILHGLLAGRQAIGSFVYWSYGIVVALIAVAVLVRILASSLSSRDAVRSASPHSDPTRAGGQSMPTRAAALGLMGQLTGTMPLAGASPALAAAGRPGAGGTGALPALEPFPPVTRPAPQAIAAPLPSDFGTGPQPAYGVRSRPPGRSPSGPGGPPPGYPAGPPPRGTGPLPRAATGPTPQPGTGPIPRMGTGPMPRPGTGPQPRMDTGPQPRMGTGPMPQPGTGPIPRVGSGPQPRAGTGPMPRPGTGPMPRPDTAPQPVYRDEQADYRSVYRDEQADYRPGPPPARPAGPPPGYGQDPRAAAYRPDRPDPRYQPPGPVPSAGPPPGYGAGPGYGPGPGSHPYETSHPYGNSTDSEPYGAPYRGSNPYQDEAPYDRWAYESGPDQGHGAPPPPPADRYPSQPRPGRRRRPAGPDTGPVPRIPSYGGDERR